MSGVIVMKKIKNACVYPTSLKNERMFGEVVEDERFISGRIIQTSPVLKVDYDEKCIRTKNGTIYEYENIFSPDNYLDFCEKNYPKETFEYISNCILNGI